MKKTSKKDTKLGIFKLYGTEFIGESDSQYHGSCVFCDSEDKFYVNKKNYLWDCKYCGLKGNTYIYLDLISELFAKAVRKSSLKNLALDRGLPVEAFKDWHIGKYKKWFTIPVKSASGHVQDIRKYSLNGKIMSTQSCSCGMLGLHKLVSLEKSTPVYICEGEWDCIALQWLLNRTKNEGVCVAVPGAGTFKQEWVEHFKDRKVYVLYDNDIPGETGEQAVHRKLNSIAKEINYVHWSARFKQGYDIRDLVVEMAVDNMKPKTAYSLVHKMMRKYPRSHKGSDAATKALDEKEKDKKIIYKHTSLSKVHAVLRKYLYISDINSINFILAVTLAKELEGDPIWAFIVAPPGGCKTELLSSLDKYEDVYITSSLTPQSLISGANLPGGVDASLIPELNGKILVLKDFTSISSQRDTSRDEIFGILRDAYDGKCGKVFGTGQRKYYESRFGIIAGVTPVIYELSTKHQSLGERFLKYAIGSNLQHDHEIEICKKAIGNINIELSMRDEISNTVRDFIWTRKIEYKDKHPQISTEYVDKIISLSQFCARMRGSVQREKYRSEIITSKPSAEVASRLSKTFAKISTRLCVVRGGNKVEEADYVIVKKCALDTLEQRREEIVKTIYTNCETINDTLSSRELCRITGYPKSTIQRLLEDMKMLEIVDRFGKMNNYEWNISKYLRKLISNSGLYTSDIELNRPKYLKSIKIKVRKRNAKQKVRKKVRVK